MQLPITALGLTTPLGTSPEDVFFAMCGVRQGLGLATSEAISAFDQVLPALGRATGRWGAHRVAVVVAAEPHELDALRLEDIAARCGARGPALFQVGSVLAGANGLATAERWIEGNLVDAVAVGAKGGGAAGHVSEGWLLLERHGRSEVCIGPSDAEVDHHPESWSICALPELEQHALSALAGLGAATAIAYTAVATLSITEGRRPDRVHPRSVEIETDAVVCGFGGMSFTVEVHAS